MPSRGVTERENSPHNTALHILLHQVPFPERRWVSRIIEHVALYTYCIGPNSGPPHTIPKPRRHQGQYYHYPFHANVIVPFIAFALLPWMLCCSLPVPVDYHKTTHLMLATHTHLCYLATDSGTMNFARA